MFFCPNCNNAFDITKTVPGSGSDSSAPPPASSSSAPSSAPSSASSSAPSSGVAEPSLDGGKKALDYATVIDKIISRESIGDIDFNDFAEDNLLKTSSYTKLSKANKELVYNTIQDILPESHPDKKINTIGESKQYIKHKIYFVCNNCGFTKPMENKTKIFSRGTNNRYVSESYDNMIYSDILPVTRNYICSDKSCPSHKDETKREFKMFRMNNSFQIKYICLACKKIDN